MGKHSFIGLLLFACIVCSCNTTTYDPDGRYVTDNFVQVFMKVESLSLSQVNADQFRVSTSGDCFNGGKDCFISRKYDDFHYKAGILPFGITCTANEFIALDIVSDSDFNGIPAGNSIASKFKFVSLSPYQWLVNKLKFDWKNLDDDYRELGFRSYGSHFSQMSPVVCDVENLGYSSLQLLDCQDIRLVLEERPSVKHHKFTVTFYESDKSISSTIEVYFE